MPGFWAAAGRALTGQSVDAAAGRAAARHLAGRPSREPGSSRWANRGFAISAFNELFARWFPSLELNVTVEVQGSPTTPDKAVLHTALSIAFGMITNRRLTNVGMQVSVDHGTNAVRVSYTISTVTLLELINLSMALLDQATGALGAAVQRGVTKALEGWFSDAPSIKQRGTAAAVPASGLAPDNNGAGRTVEQALKDVYDRINKEIGPGAVWAMPKDKIVGGQAPKLFRTFEAQKPFDDMDGITQLTREPAANPQPPAGLGFDLRTLVAQVLHDPGVRPPLPRTDQGPPVVANELLGA